MLKELLVTYEGLWYYKAVYSIILLLGVVVGAIILSPVETQSVPDSLLVKKLNRLGVSPKKRPKRLRPMAE